MPGTKTLLRRSADGGAAGAGGVDGAGARGRAAGTAGADGTGGVGGRIALPCSPDSLCETDGLQGAALLAPAVGLEPTTKRLTVARSTN
ncbi:MAG: hypothetical protein PVH21_17170, partial [Myxococcales bacterium]